MSSMTQLLDDIARTRSAYHNAVERGKQHAPDLFKAVRAAHHLTQRDLAEKLNCHWTYISKIENGHVAPGKPTLDRLEAYLREVGDYVQ